MWSYLRDKWETARLKAHHERLMQQQRVDLLESSRPQPVAEDPGRWALVGSGSGPGAKSTAERNDLRQLARQMVRENPHARQILRLLEAYVVGEGFQLTFVCRCGAVASGLEPLIHEVNALWQSFLEANEPHFSFCEYARRVWRDGECFLRIYPQEEWPPQVRFIDPEAIAATAEDPQSEGIETEPHDVETPRFYLRIDPRDGSLKERIPAAEILHTKIGVDSNEKRGSSFFASILKPLEQFQQWEETELLARKLQSSIVLWRKVQGTPAQTTALADSLRSERGPSGGVSGETRHERVRPGTILTTSAGTEIKYLQPNTNFGDAVPLGRMILLGIAAGAGIPEFMLTADASNANYSSTMVAEGPAVKLFLHEQKFFTTVFNRLWKLLIREAIALQLIPEDVLEVLEPRWSYPQLISRDRPREREADVQLVQAGILSRAEVQRRENLNPQQMRAELEAEFAARGESTTEDS